MAKINLKDIYTCPFDSKEGLLGDLALHMGLKDDKQHEDWRKEHKLREINIRNVSKMRFEIFVAIGQDGNLFKPRKK